MDQSRELLEVLTEDGISTGVAEKRGIVHKKGLWHRAIIIAIMNEHDQVLMQKRAMEKEKFAGLWDLSVAGHVPFGFDSISCAVKETEEEIGCLLTEEVKVSDFRFISSFRNKYVVSEDFIENQFYDFFVWNWIRGGGDTDLSQLQLQAEEVEEIKWMSIDEVIALGAQNKLHPRKEWVELLKNFLEKHKYKAEKD